MDCNVGTQLGRQFNKDAMAMPGAVHIDPAMSEQDTLMQLPHMMQGVPPGMGPEWATAFQQSQSQAMARQQHEMEQAFLAAQQQSAPQSATAGVTTMPAGLMPSSQQVQQQMVGGMLASNMGFGMMMPRTQYQPTALNLFQSQQQPSTALNTAATTQEDWAAQLGQQQWTQDYSQVQNLVVEGQADETVETKTKNSEFYAFMDRVRNHELIIDEEKGEVVAGPGPEAEVAEDTEYLKQWAEQEGLNMPESVFRPVPTAPPGAETLEETGNDVLGTAEEADDWAREYMEAQQRMEKAENSTDYPFEPNNPYLHHDNPFEDGMQMLQLANLAEAALAFEAACQRNTEHFEAWRVLGTTQAENEKDFLAVLALNNARRINPNDLNVLAALSVSHTNEHNTEAAMNNLKRWLLCHPEYEQLGQIHIEPDPHLDLEDSEGYFFVDPTQMREISTLYHAAVEMNPNDADLYTNLGVLHNIAHDFELAADNFRKAVALRPSDAKLWNKLGATLANGSHPDAALEAYHHALDANPGYVRAMYNMAVAYNNLGKYQQAGRQVVRALALQQGDTDPKGEATLMATRGMWDLLRMVLNLMDRQDLIEQSYQMNLAPFIQAFGLEGIV